MSAIHLMSILNKVVAVGIASVVQSKKYEEEQQTQRLLLISINSEKKWFHVHRIGRSFACWKLIMEVHKYGITVPNP